MNSASTITFIIHMSAAAANDEQFYTNMSSNVLTLFLFPFCYVFPLALCFIIIIMSTTSQAPNPTGRAVFCHYMVGTMSPEGAVADVQQAQAMGIDAFALNVVTATDSWSTDALRNLFAAARGTNFKLFFSFDMTRFWSPTDAIPLLLQYHKHSAYYKRNGIPFTSTFYGGTLSFGHKTSNTGWQVEFRDVLTTLSIQTYFVPAFDDSPVDPDSFFTTFPVVDGLFSWENSWPWVHQGIVSISSSKDQAYFTAAQKAGKSYMMGISALQFKHIDSSMNWYRRGGLNLALRIPQILSLGPDFVQIQTWNDAGESHYIGNIWPESISGTEINKYTDGYNHSGWQVLLQPFIAAYKAYISDVTHIVPTGDDTVQGVFWHSTLLSSASCNGDALGKPRGSENIQDTIEVAIIVAEGVRGIMVQVYSNGTQIASLEAKQGLNAWEVPGLKAGQVTVDVVDWNGRTLLSGTGALRVVADSSYCNYNAQVVKLGTPPPNRR